MCLWGRGPQSNAFLISSLRMPLLTCQCHLTVRYVEFDSLKTNSERTNSNRETATGAADGWGRARPRALELRRFACVRYTRDSTEPNGTLARTASGPWRTDRLSPTTRYTVSGEAADLSDYTVRYLTLPSSSNDIVTGAAATRTGSRATLFTTVVRALLALSLLLAVLTPRRIVLHPPR